MASYIFCEFLSKHGSPASHRVTAMIARTKWSHAHPPAPSQKDCTLTASLKAVTIVNISSWPLSNQENNTIFQGSMCQWLWTVTMCVCQWLCTVTMCIERRTKSLLTFLFASEFDNAKEGRIGPYHVYEHSQVWCCGPKKLLSLFLSINRRFRPHTTHARRCRLLDFRKSSRFRTKAMTATCLNVPSNLVIRYKFCAQSFQPIQPKRCTWTLLKRPHGPQSWL